MKKLQKLLLLILSLLFFSLILLSVDSAQRSFREDFGSNSNSYITLNPASFDNDFNKIITFAEENELNIIGKKYHSTGASSQNMSVFGYFSFVTNGMKKVMPEADYFDQFVGKKQFKIDTSIFKNSDVLNNDFFEVKSISEVLDSNNLMQGSTFEIYSTKNNYEELTQELNSLNVGEANSSFRYGSGGSNGLSLYIIIQMLAILLVVIVIHYLYYIDAQSKSIGVYTLYSSRAIMFKNIIGSILITLNLSLFLIVCLSFVMIPSQFLTDYISTYIFVFILANMIYLGTFFIKSRASLIANLKNKTSGKSIVNLLKFSMVITLIITSAALTVSIENIKAINSKEFSYVTAEQAKDYVQLKPDINFLRSNPMDGPLIANARLLPKYPLLNKEGSLLVNNYQIENERNYKEAIKSGCKGPLGAYCSEGLPQKALETNLNYIIKYLPELKAKYFTDFNENNPSIYVFYKEGDEKGKEYAARQYTNENQAVGENEKNVKMIPYVENIKAFTFMSEIEFAYSENPVVAVYSEAASSKYLNFGENLYIPSKNQNSTERFTSLTNELNDPVLIGESGYFTGVETKADVYNEYIQKQKLMIYVATLQLITTLTVLAVVLWVYILTVLKYKIKEIIIMSLSGHSMFQKYSKIFQFQIIAWYTAVLITTVLTIPIMPPGILRLFFTTMLYLLPVLIFTILLTTLLISIYEYKSIIKVVKGGE